MSAMQALTSDTTGVIILGLYAAVSAADQAARLSRGYLITATVMVVITVQVVLSLNGGLS